MEVWCTKKNTNNITDFITMYLEDCGQAECFLKLAETLSVSTHWV